MYNLTPSRICPGGACFAAGYFYATHRTVQRPHYLAVSLVDDHILSSVSTVFEDNNGHFIADGDKIRFLGKNSVGMACPDSLDFQRWDFLFPKMPKNEHNVVLCSSCPGEVTFFVRDGGFVRVAQIEGQNPR
jgi:hypothetical protein